MELLLAFAVGVMFGYGLATMVLESRRQKMLKQALKTLEKNDDKRPSANRRSNKKK